jgi:predicted dehydrogenase
MTSHGLGIIGADGRGRFVWEAHRPDQGFRIHATCSLHLENIRDIHDKLSPDIALTTDYREVLGRPEISAVFVCSPDYLHEEHAVAALEAGKHVFLEKPMAITIEACDRIRAAAKRHGRILYIGHNMRFFPVLRKMREIIESGRIGEVQAVWCRHFISYGGDAYFKDWHSEQKNVTGLLLQKGAHDLDIIHWLAGGYTRRVVGMGKLSVYDKLPRREGELAGRAEFNPANYPPKNTSGYSPVINVEDHSMLLLDMANGVQGCYTQCHYTPDDGRNYTVIGTEGRIENYGDMPEATKPASIQLWNQRTGYEHLGHETINIPHFDGSHGGADPFIVEDFLRALKGETTHGASSLDARMAVAAGVLGTQSLRNGNMPYDVTLPVE